MAMKGLVVEAGLKVAPKFLEHYRTVSIVDHPYYRRRVAKKVVYIFLFNR